MCLIISLVAVLAGLAGVAFGLMQRRGKAILRRQLEAFHAAGLEKDRQIERLLARNENLTAERDNMQDRFEQVMYTDVRNLLHYDGTDKGQVEHGA